MGTGFELTEKGVVLRVNPNIYPLERVYATAYVFLDKYYFMLDGDKEKEIVITVTPKKKGEDLELFAKKFFEEMLSITNYFNLFERNKEVIGMILQRALFSVAPKPLTEEERKALQGLEPGRKQATPE